MISASLPPGWQTPYIPPRSGTPPFQGAPPPMPAGYGFDQQQWAQGVWAENPLWTPYQGPANGNAWAPGPSWGMPPTPYIGNPGWPSTPPALQQPAYLPPKPKRQTKPPSAEYFAQPLSANGLQLEQMVQAPDRYGEGQHATPRTPWVWNPTPLSNPVMAPSSTQGVQQPGGRAPLPSSRELRPTFGPGIIVTADHYKALRSRRADSQASIPDRNSGAGSVNASSEQIRRTKSDSNDPTEVAAGGRKHRQKNEPNPLRPEAAEPAFQISVVPPSPPTSPQSSPPSPEIAVIPPSPRTPEVTVIPPSPQVTKQTPEDGKNRQLSRTPDPERRKHREKHKSGPLRREASEPPVDSTSSPSKPPDRDGYDDQWRKKGQELKEREEGVKRKELELKRREEEIRRREKEAKQKELELTRKEEEAGKREEDAKRKELGLVQEEEDARRRDEEIREERSRFEEERKEARKTEEDLHEEIKRLEKERIASRQREEELRESKEEVERREREMVARFNQQQAKLREYEEAEIRRQAKAKEEEAKREAAARKERNRQRTQGPSSYYPPSGSSHSWMPSLTHTLDSPGASLFSSPISIASYSTIREEGGEGITDWQRRQEETYRRQQEQFRKEQERLESPRRIQWSTTQNAT